MTNEPRPARDPKSLRIGDAERERAAAALGEHFTAGRLQREEFDARLDAAYAARTRADIEQLFADLPEPSPFTAPRPKPVTPPARHHRLPPAVPFVTVIAILLTLAVLTRFPPAFGFVFLWIWLGGHRRVWR